MTVSARQIELAQTKLANVMAIAQACDKIGARFYLACAMISKESGGRNVYGHDVGGALSGFEKPVNQYNFEVFEWLVFEKKHPSNGVGPAQLTYPGFFTDMRNKNLWPWDPFDNIFYGVNLINDYYRQARDERGMTVENAIRYAGKRYNGSSVYGDSLVAVAKTWRSLVGDEDFK